MTEKKTTQASGTEHIAVQARDGRGDIMRFRDGSTGWIHHGLSSLITTSIFDGKSGFLSEYSLHNVKHIWRDIGYIVGATQAGCAAASASDGEATAGMLLGAIKGRTEGAARPMMLHMREIANVAHMRGCAAEARIIVEAAAGTVAPMDDMHALGALRLVITAAHYTKDNATTLGMVRFIKRDGAKAAMRLLGGLDKLAAEPNDQAIREAVTAIVDKGGRDKALSQLLTGLARRISSGECGDARENRSVGCMIRKLH